MSLLAAKLYDPGTAAAKPTSALLAMTALNTSQLGVTFTAPANGAVIVRLLGGSLTGASTAPQILLGILDGATVRGRQAPQGSRVTNTSSMMMALEAVSLVTGLTPGNSYTFDLAYGVELAVASTNLKYGGPNDSTNTTAFGAASIEVWSTETLLAGIHYDPPGAVTFPVSAASPMSVIDPAMQLTFTAPASGNVMVRHRGVVHGETVSVGANLLFGVLEGATIRGRVHALQSLNNSGANPLASDQLIARAKSVITGLTPGNSYTWDAAVGVEIGAANAAISMGGPNNNTTQDDAFGGFSFDIWDAGGTAGGIQYAYAIGQVI